jgi:hypothetical protein
VTRLRKGQAGHGLGMSTDENWAQTGHALGTDWARTEHGHGRDWAQTEQESRASTAQVDWAQAGHRLGTGGLCPNITGTH